MKQMSEVQARQAIVHLREIKKSIEKMRATCIQLLEHPDATPEGICAAAQTLSKAVANYRKYYDRVGTHGDYRAWTLYGKEQCRL